MSYEMPSFDKEEMHRESIFTKRKKLPYGDKHPGDKGDGAIIRRLGRENYEVGEAVEKELDSLKRSDPSRSEALRTEYEQAFLSLESAQVLGDEKTPTDTMERIEKELGIDRDQIEKNFKEQRAA